VDVAVTAGIVVADEPVDAIVFDTEFVAGAEDVDVTVAAAGVESDR